MDVNYEHYHIFYYVAKYRSFTKAAAVLFRSQPNLTRAVRQLEQQLGCQLLIRSNRGVALTAEGQQLYRHVSAAFDQLQQAEEELSRSTGLQSGSVSIGASETALHLYLLDRLRDFRRRYPHVKLKIYNLSVAAALSAARDGLVDLTVVTTPTNSSAPLQEQTLLAFQDILVAGPGLAHLADRPRTLQELADYPLIGMEQNTNSFHFFSKFYLEGGLMFEPDIQVATTDLILPMIRSDLGIGFLPRPLARRALADGAVTEVPLRTPLPPRQVCLVYDPTHLHSVAAREMCRFLTEGGGFASDKPFAPRP